MYKSRMLLRSLTESTIRTRLENIKACLISNDIPLPFTFDDLYPVLLNYKRQKSSAYLNCTITSLNDFIRFLQSIKHPQEDITNLLNGIRPREDRSPDPTRVLSVSQVEAICSFRRVGYEGTGLNRGYKTEYLNQIDTIYNTLFYLIAQTGCRSGEAIKLKKEDINFELHNLIFRKTKNGKARIVALVPSLEKVLQDYIKDLDDNQYLFTSHTQHLDSPISQPMVNRVFKTRCSALGIRRATVHWLRHFYTTQGQINGISTPVMQKIVGHKRMSTTELYTHINTEMQREQMIKGNPLEARVHDDITLVEKIEDYLNTLKVDPKRIVRYYDQAKKRFIVEICGVSA